MAQRAAVGDRLEPLLLDLGRRRRPAVPALHRVRGAAAPGGTSLPPVPIRSAGGATGVRRGSRPELHHELSAVVPRCAGPVCRGGGRARGGPPDPRDDQHRRVRPRGRPRGHASARRLRAGRGRLASVVRTNWWDAAGVAGRTRRHGPVPIGPLDGASREVRGRRRGDGYRHVASGPEADGGPGRAQRGGDRAGRGGTPGWRWRTSTASRPIPPGRPTAGIPKGE